MAPSDEGFNLLLVHADDRSPVVELTSDTAAAQGEAGVVAAEHLWDEGGPPNDIALQRWGVIAPEGAEGDRLLDVAAPLIAARRAQQDGHPVKIYRVPPKLTQAEAMRWRKAVFDTGEDLNIDVPRYQLILGDLHQVPLAVQQVQSSDGYVGRLVFPTEEGYRAYIDKLLRWEERPSTERRGDAILHTVHDGTAATTVGHRSLIGPGMKILQTRLASGELEARRVLEAGDRWNLSPQALLDVAKTTAPSVLFTLGHGQGAPRAGWTSGEEQRQEQGALSFGREGMLRAADLLQGAFLPGGIWFMLACFGAGTPDESAYAHWLESLREVGQYRGKTEAVLRNLPASTERPFVSALPQAVLANPDGPLAVIGHVDLAWTYSFQELDTGATNRPARFIGLVRSLLKQDRAGVALREVVRFFGLVDGELTALYDDEARGRGTPDRARRGHLWMLRQDLSGYMLLGDPAARLSLAPSPARGTNPPSVSPATFAPQSAGTPQSAGAQQSAVAHQSAPEPAGPLPLPIDQLEEAIVQVLLGERGSKAIAAEFGLPRADLDRLSSLYRDAGRRALGG